MQAAARGRTVSNGNEQQHWRHANQYERPAEDEAKDDGPEEVGR